MHNNSLVQRESIAFILNDGEIGAFIKKGIIVGICNTIWQSLNFRISSYNCVNIPIQDNTSKDKPYPKKKEVVYLSSLIKNIVKFLCVTLN